MERGFLTREMGDMNGFVRCIERKFKGNELEYFTCIRNCTSLVRLGSGIALLILNEELKILGFVGG